jgi:hypothetical protein
VIGAAGLGSGMAASGLPRDDGIGQGLAHMHGARPYACGPTKCGREPPGNDIFPREPSVFTNLAGLSIFHAS